MKVQFKTQNDLLYEKYNFVQIHFHSQNVVKINFYIKIEKTQTVFKEIIQLQEFEVKIISILRNRLAIYRGDQKIDDLIQNRARICRSDLGQFEFYTVVSIRKIKNIFYKIESSSTNKYKIKICFNSKINDMEIGIRNLLIFIYTCYPTCLSCNDPSEIQCLLFQQFECIRRQIYLYFQLIIFRNIQVFDKNTVENIQLLVMIQYFTLFGDDSNTQSNHRYCSLIFEQDEFHPKKKRIYLMKIVVELALQESFNFIKECYTNQVLKMLQNVQELEQHFIYLISNIQAN
ncbi:unnamed protein product [Paramecium primaurelia]|uniref:Uncharacterized protein n=1 Tax=Paramecium primaurelia TaxID=5886 RepID=A0A8S1PCW4_PARPR|nr:unnamed protein product [Paramecium primaurelia]